MTAQQHLPRKITLDNHIVTLRRVAGSDRNLEADFVRKLSAQSRHYRFLGGVRELSEKRL